MRNVYVSFGENCLTDHILNRYALKTFSTPYSWGRSNIEYILQIEEDNFRDFLNEHYLKYEQLNGRTVVRLKHYDVVRNQYEPLGMNGFEFTHHNVIADQEVREKMERRCRRLMELKEDHVYIFYHHRYCEDTNRDMLIGHLARLKALYQTKCRHVEVIMFTQVIVHDNARRKVESSVVNGIRVFEFHTMRTWTGNDPQLLYARCDDDLIRKMIREVKRGAQRRLWHDRWRRLTQRR